MKKLILSVLCVVIVAIAAVLISCAPNDGVMKKEKGVYIVNTTNLSKDVIGYNGTTPLNIYIKDDKIQKVEALPNEETPRFFDMVKAGLLNKWNGMTVKQAMDSNIDAVTGATFSSNAVKENVKMGLQYYQKHKK